MNELKHPESVAQKPIVVMERGTWHRAYQNFDEVYSGDGPNFYHGKALNHPRLGTQYVTTTRVLWETDDHPNYRVVETLNTFYFLEK